MPNSGKITAVAEITEHFTNSSAAVITEYRGLTVKQVTDLRRSLGRGTTYAVVKNTLTKRAAANAGVAIDDSLLVGPTAIAFVTGDPVEAAKGLRDFAKTNPLLIIKGGILDGHPMSPAEINKIADLDSREVLLAKLAGALKALPTRAAALFQAPLSQMARLAKALEEKKPAVPTAPVAELSEPAAVDVGGRDAPVAEVAEVAAVDAEVAEPAAVDAEVAEPAAVDVGGADAPVAEVGEPAAVDAEVAEPAAVEAEVAEVAEPAAVDVGGADAPVAEVGEPPALDAGSTEASAETVETPAETAGESAAPESSAEPAE
jgi:large subunit ribosomal protein L10